MTPRSKRILTVAGVLAPVIGGVFWMRALASWRPVKVGHVQREYLLFFLSADGHTCLLGRQAEGYKPLYLGDITSQKTSPQLVAKPYELTFSHSLPELTAFVSRRKDQDELRIHEVQSGHLQRTFRWPAKQPFLPVPSLDREGKTAGVVQGFTFFQWSIESGKLIRSVKLADSSTRHKLVFKYALSPDGTQLIGCAKSQGKIWSTNSGKLLRSWKTIAYDFPVFFSADAHTVAYTYVSTTRFQTYNFVDTATGNVMWKTDDIVSASSTEGSEIFFPRKTNCEVLDIATGRLVRHLPGPRQSDGEILRVTPDTIYTLNAKNEIFRWRAR